MGVGNYAVASHSLFYGWRYEELLFSPLRRAEKGMKIYTRDSEKIYTYVISDIFVVNPDAGYVASDTEGDGLITMITCTDRYATQRLIPLSMQASMIFIAPLILVLIHSKLRVLC